MPPPIQKDPFTELHLDVIACSKCRLRDGCAQPVGGAGDAKADIVVIGEAPGYTEDKEGIPFIGKSGTRLNKWLKLAGLRRRDLWVTNVLKCQPTALVDDGKGNTIRRMRFPSDADNTDGPVDQCLPWLHRELRLLQPLAVVLAGKRALHHVLMRDSLDSADPISPWVGKILRRRDLFGETRFGVMYHPSFILRSKNPWDESACIETLKKIADYVKAVRGGEPAPPIELTNVRPGKTIQHQQRMTLFGGPHESTD